MGDSRTTVISLSSHQSRRAIQELVNKNLLRLAGDLRDPMDTSVGWLIREVSSELRAADEEKGKSGVASIAQRRRQRDLKVLMDVANNEIAEQSNARRE